ncbi:MAG: hypothetical protein PHS40_11160, partial [Mariniphaga sp.]|nr:hypothetical protein [Mariniphaga sp.]
VMWPDGIKNPGRIIHDFVSFIDFAPTYLELAGLTPGKTGMEPVTGRSLTEYFYTQKDGNVFPERDFMLVGKERHDVGRPDDQGYPVRGIIKDNYLYLQNFKPERWPKGNPETGYLNCDGSPTKTYILNTRRKKGIMEYWQLNFGKRTAEELYNIVQDPYCLNNLAEDSNYADIQMSLKNEMVEKLKEQKDPRILGMGDVFDNYPYQGDVQNYYNRYMLGEDVPAGWVNKTDYDTDLK